MDLCRICLSSSTEKDIQQLKTGKHKVTKSYYEILYFCLDIQVTEGSNITTKLCRKCYRKILSFYEFKTLALESDTYLKAVSKDCFVKLEAFDKDNKDNSINNETESNNNDFLDEPAFKTENDSNNDEPEVKMEDISNVYESDDEILSVIKEEDSLILKTLEQNHAVINAPLRKRGRPKQVKPVKLKEKLKKQICEECGESVWDIRNHSKKHNPLKDRKEVPCELCEKVLSSRRALKRHTQRKHLAVKYSCEICGKEVYNIQSHKLRMHEQDKLKCQCIVCEKRFISQAVLNEHMLLHTKDKPFECDICQKRFRLKVVLVHHKRQVHDKEKSHLCQFCSKSFFKKHHLQVHIRRQVHDKERSHLCQYCSKSFFMKHHLQIHIRSHTKEKPYKCDDCGRAFADSTTLKNHRMTHSTEKNFQCDYCEMKFARRDYLRTHMVCHTKERKHSCKYCGVRFFRSDHCKRHQYTAHEKHLLTTAVTSSVSHQEVS